MEFKYSVASVYLEPQNNLKNICKIFSSVWLYLFAIVLKTKLTSPNNEKFSLYGFKIMYCNEIE
jgi:hypothetical protein